jgi:hypothetical protein
MIIAEVFPNLPRLALSQTNGSGWQGAQPLGPPPGTKIIDALCDEQDRIDRAERALALAKAELAKIVREKAASVEGSASVEKATSVDVGSSKEGPRTMEQ